MSQSFAAPKLLWEGLASLIPRPLCLIYRLLNFFHFFIFSSPSPPPLPPDYSVFWNFEMPIPPSIWNWGEKKSEGRGGVWLIQKSLPRTLNLSKTRTRSHIFVLISCLSDSNHLTPYHVTKTSKLVAAALMWKGLKRAQISSLLWKSTSYLELLVNQYNNETLETNDPENIFFKYSNIYKMHHIAICNKNKCPSSIWIHVLLINDLQYLTSFTKLNFDLKGVTETRILNRYLY